MDLLFTIPVGFFLLLLAPPDKMVAQAGTEPESDHALRDLLLDTCLNVLSS